jgi:alpha-tubulin suppressor-like RCC1 family protein
VKGAVCGASASAVTMSGKGTGGVVGISPGQLDFLKVNCGAKANTQVFTILNSGNATFNWTAALGKGASSAFDISPSTGIVLAGSQTQVFVTPKQIPTTSAITDNLYGDTLTVTTDAANDTPHPVPLLMTAKGAILAFTTTPTDYGLRTMFGPTASKPVSVTNTGNATANVTFVSSTAAYTFNPSVATPVLAAGALNATVEFAPIDFGGNPAQLSITSNDVLCAPLPAAVALSGQGKGEASNVGVGSVGYRGSDGTSACAVLTGGHVACWGDNTFGQLGIGAAGVGTSSGVPVIIPNFSGAAAIAAGGDFNCARTTAGTVYCWGRNTNRQDRVTGQLGTAGAANKTSPTLVAGVTNVISLGAAERHVCAVSTTVFGGTSGKLVCWGNNRRGNLGTGTINDSSTTPVQVMGITDAISVTVAGFGGCARRVGNVVSCWGQNNGHGELGNGTTTNNTNGAPTTVTGLSTAIAIASGGHRRRSGISCAAQSTGGVVCWGDNSRSHQKLQPNTTIAVPTPVPMTGVTTATSVTAGRGHMCALIAGGAVQCWGRGNFGQLGNGAAPDNSPPVNVMGLVNATQISAAHQATCAVLTSGQVTCWGSNAFGELGNVAAASTQSTPLVVTGF